MKSAQEPRSTVDVVLVVALDSSAFPATDSFPTVSSTVWATPREQGFWEKDVCLLWRSMGRIYPDWEDKQYLPDFRVSKDTFWYLCQTYGKHFKKQTTHLRRPLLPSKRLAIVLHWLAQANSYSELAAMYAVGKSTVVAIAHEGIAILLEKLVPKAILFPTGRELNQATSLVSLPTGAASIIA